MLKRLHSAGGGLHVWKIALRVGKRRVHRHITATRQGAQQAYSELVNQQARAKIGLAFSIPTEAPRLSHAAERYEVNLRTLNQNTEHIAAVARTLRALRGQLGDGCPVDHVTRADLLAWQQRRAESKPGVTPRTVNKERAHLSAFFAWCVEAGWIPANPVATVKRIKETAPPLRALDWQTFSKITAWLWENEPHTALLVEVLGETGGRVGEVMRAKAGDVDSRQGIWSKVVKGGRRIELPAGPWVLKAAAAHGAETPLCPRKDGSPWTHGQLKCAFRRVREALKLPGITPHWIRHGRATWDLESGLPIRAVQEKLSHTTVVTTERYLRAGNVLKGTSDGYAVKAHKVPKSLCLPCDKGVSARTLVGSNRPATAQEEKRLKSRLGKALRCKSGVDR